MNQNFLFYFGRQLEYWCFRPDTDSFFVQTFEKKDYSCWEQTNLDF